MAVRGLVSRHRDCDGLAYRRMGSASGGIRSWMLRAAPGAREMRPRSMRGRLLIGALPTSATSSSASFSRRCGGLTVACENFRELRPGMTVVHLHCPKKNPYRDSTLCEHSNFSRETGQAQGCPEHCKWDSAPAAAFECEAPATRISDSQTDLQHLRPGAGRKSLILLDRTASFAKV